MIPRLRGALAVVSLSLVAACGHVPISTLYQLRKFDPATFDPAPVRIAVRLADAIEPRKGTSVFHMKLMMPGHEPEKQQHDFVLEPLPLASEPALQAFRKVGEAIHVFRFSATDGERIRTIQREVAESRAKGRRGGQLTIEVSSKACRKGPLPAGALPSTTLIRTEAQGPYLVLLQDVDLRAEAQKHNENLEAEIPPC
jgi:hypothetical protein